MADKQKSYLHPEVSKDDIVYPITKVECIEDLPQPTSDNKGKVLSSNGSEIVFSEPVKGEQGIQGEKGDQGEQGIQGEKGDQGDKGLDVIIYTGDITDETLKDSYNNSTSIYITADDWNNYSNVKIDKLNALFVSNNPYIYLSNGYVLKIVSIDYAITQIDIFNTSLTYNGVKVQVIRNLNGNSVITGASAISHTSDDDYTTTTVQLETDSGNYNFEVYAKNGESGSSDSGNHLYEHNLSFSSYKTGDTTYVEVKIAIFTNSSNTINNTDELFNIIKGYDKYLYGFILLHKDGVTYSSVYITFDLSGSMSEVRYITDSENLIAIAFNSTNNTITDNIRQIF
jgi:hypothetical protein